MRKFSLAILTAALLAIGLALLPAVSRAEGGDRWIESYHDALKQGKEQHKTILMNFTGSDWCPWCIKLEHEIFETAEFKQYAAKSLILLKLDFPQSLAQSDELKKQNQRLQEQYKIEGYPTVIVLNSEGKQIGQLGYMEGGPGPFLAALKKLK